MVPRLRSTSPTRVPLPSARRGLGCWSRVNPLDEAYERVVQTMAELREAWQSGMRATADGKARIARAIQEQNAAASRLAAAWNSGSGTERPALSPLEELPGKPHTADGGDPATPRAEIEGPGE